MCKQNLGKLDRILRFILAIWWLGLWAPQYSALWVNWVIFIGGWIALVESFLAYCPLHDWMNINNKNQ